MPYKDPAAKKQYQKEWAARHPEKVKAHSKKWFAAHRDNELLRLKTWRLNNREKVRLIQRAAKWKEYGIVLTDEQWNALYARQDGRCAICNRHSSEFTQRLCVDHNHTTGRVRGLLCTVCNAQILVTVEKYSHLILKATEYLRDERDIKTTESQAINISRLERVEETDRCVGSPSGSIT